MDDNSAEGHYSQAKDSNHRHYELIVVGETIGPAVLILLLHQRVSLAVGTVPWLRDEAVLANAVESVDELGPRSAGAGSRQKCGC